MSGNKIENREVWCVEREEFNTIGYFAEQLGLKKVYYISDVVDKPNRSAGGCHFVSLEYAAENPTTEVKKPHHRRGFGVQCREDGTEWDSIAACAKALGFDYQVLYRYVNKVEKGYTGAFEDGRHYAVVADYR